MLAPSAIGRAVRYHRVVSLLASAARLPSPRTIRNKCLLLLCPLSLLLQLPEWTNTVHIDKSPT